MFIYCICTQYLVGAPFVLITASIRRGMEVISLWHCWGGMEVGSGLVSLLAGQAHQHHGNLPPFGTFGSVGRCLILLENEISIFKKLVSRRKHEVLQYLLVNRCGDVGFQKTQWTNTSRRHCTPNHHRLWKLNTGLQATWAMSFFTLPPDSRTLVSKWNTKLALIWKEDFGPLGNSPVLLHLSPGKTPLTITVAKFIDTSVCGGSWCLDPSLKILIRLRFSRLIVYPSTLFSFHSTSC